ncbi:MAG: 3-oxoacyl-ACP synthase [Chlamydiae bacterium RIFCSPHIGHO2_12_FULL_49_11]|nr:MAG: 3-oxoacyl-ACP synthase [Chlamydiae bacterium RIFCSPHIGHO2_12_FULL_49_11]
MKQRRAKILAVESYLPKKILTNDDMAVMVDTSDDWIVSRVGIKQRHIAAEGEFTSTMGVRAAQKILDKTGIDPASIDMVIVTTLSPDYLFPSTACLIQSELGLTNAAAFDLQAACSGLVYGLATAKAFIESGQASNILLIASEKLSAFVDYTDRNTCILFGDGASAVLVTEGSGIFTIGEFVLGADGTCRDLLCLPGGGARNPASHETVDQKKHFIKMEGREVFKHAVRRMEEAMEACLKKAGLESGDISYLVPHQANLRIIEALRKRFQISPERVIVTVDLYANTSASSIGIALEHLMHNHPLALHDKVLLAVFGSGFTFGSMVLEVTGEVK